ncbi:hypothetical protein C1646_753419 [Rhizophagus diaphanus]|nr:hypothetical protein C1646_753419 [Rhizophagus diaphanus] [Rhizophagus sp. MUCL 43196]
MSRTAVLDEHRIACTRENNPQPPVSTYDQVPLQPIKPTLQLRKLKREHELAEQDKQRLNDEIIQAKLLGTSHKKLDQRLAQVDDLTFHQNDYHKRLTSLMKRSTKNIDLAISVKLEKEYTEFKYEFLSSADTMLPHYSHKGNTSDDTKALEVRPNKRNVNTNYNLDSQIFTTRQSGSPTEVDTSDISVKINNLEPKNFLLH